MELSDGHYDLNNCEQEPIHIPGSIQPHGVLIGLVEPALRVAVVSTNLGAILETTIEEVLSASLDTLLDAQSVQRVRSALTLPDPTMQSPLSIYDRNGRHYDGVLHRSDGLALLELEPVVELPRPAVELPQVLSRLAAELRGSRGVSELAQLTAARFKDLTGYDRCMVYRFDPDGNGEVIGEAREPKLPAYLGLRYPAADIPTQARRLYCENPLRLIVDVDYEPSPLEPATNPATGRPLDLGHAVLRSVSPFHREYLRNMGVHGTLAISLLIDGALWGLLVCHHYTPKHVRHEVRAACEVIGSFLAQRVSELERTETARRVASVHEIASELRASGPRLNASDVRTTKALEACLTQLSAKALAVHTEESTLAVGHTLDPRALSAIVERLESMEAGPLFTTDQLSQLGEPFDALAPEFAGLLAARVSHDGNWLLVLRGEQRHEVTWGAAKEKKITIQSGVPRLSPEGSFGLWKETVRGRSRAWTSGDQRAVEELQSAFRSLEAARLSELATRTRELQQVTEAKDEFLAQLSHELRTPLNTMLGWAELLLTGATTLDAQTKRGIEVIQRNAKVQARLVEDLLDVSRIVRGSLRLELSPHAVEPILRAALESIESPAAAKAIELITVIDPATGPINADPVRLQQVFWNLLSNAVKFSPKGGTVRVTLQEQHSSVVLEVENTGKGIEPELLPHVFDRFTQGKAGFRSNMGLGLGLAIAKGITELHGGQITARNTTLGVRFAVELPILAYRDHPPSEPSPLVVHDADGVDPNFLRDAHIVLVEDEPEALDVLGKMLRAAGAQVTPFASAEQALAEPALTADALVSDLGLPGKNGLDLLRELRQSGFKGSAIALTAYTSRRHQVAALKAGFSLYLSKPIDREQLLVAVGSALGRFNEAVSK